MRDQGAVFPAVLYVDCHGSHFSLALCLKCRELDVILITLHPNSTWLYQPADILPIGEVKNRFADELVNIRHSKPLFLCSKFNFSPLLKRAIKKALDDTDIIRRSFERCGLTWPLNPDAVEYTKLKAADYQEIEKSFHESPAPNDLERSWAYNYIIQKQEQGKYSEFFFY